jgi:dTDP-4-amino-4,6-dideoxygalactose transaminase
MTVASRIPILDLGPAHRALWSDIQQAIERVALSGQFIMGPDVAAFEREVAEYTGAKHAIGVNSGTDALVIALRALGIGHGHEVITTPFTFFATAEAISQVGATPRFVDIDPQTFNLDAGQLDAALTDNTRAILPVHLYGRPADMTAIMAFAQKHNLVVLEDCAQSFGARLSANGPMSGAIGHAGAYSFFPSKTLGGFGDGGMIVTNEDSVADIARALRVHGSRKKYYNEMIGYNSRLDTLQAAVLRVKLPHIDRWNEARRGVATRYGQLLSDVEGVVAPEVTATHAFHQYTVRILDGRDRVKERLDQLGVSSMIYYPVPLHQMEMYQAVSTPCPNAEVAASQVLSLPIWPDIDDATLEAVVKALASARAS